MTNLLRDVRCIGNFVMTDLGSQFSPTLTRNEGLLESVSC